MLTAVNAAAVTLHTAAGAVQGDFVERELPIPPIGFGVIAMSGFLILLGITYAFRTVANRR